jgi:hypothetical protein
MDLETWVALRAEAVRRRLTVPNMLTIALREWFAAENDRSNRLAS